jgi:hypothetical protein
MTAGDPEDCLGELTGSPGEPLRAAGSAAVMPPGLSRPGQDQDESGDGYEMEPESSGTQPAQVHPGNRCGQADAGTGVEQVTGQVPRTPMVPGGRPDQEHSDEPGTEATHEMTAPAVTGPDHPTVKESTARARSTSSAICNSRSSMESYFSVGLKCSMNSTTTISP